MAGSSTHNFTVYGSNVYAWQKAGGNFVCTVADYYNPSTVSWTLGKLVLVLPGDPDSLTFSSAVSGSTPGKSALTITVTLTPGGGSWPPCPGYTWPPEPVTYT